MGSSNPGYSADKAKDSGKLQTGKDGMKSMAAPCGSGGYGYSIDKNQGVNEGGTKTGFGNYRKKSSVAKNGVVMNSSVTQGSRFEVFLDDLKEGNEVLVDKKAKGKKPIATIKGGPSVDGKKVFDDISNTVDKSGKVSDPIFPKVANKNVKKGSKAINIVKGTATKKKPSMVVQKDPAEISLA
ncbi:hypothetical protein ACOSP7_013741 [Xanthoceras sorbifolium]